MCDYSLHDVATRPAKVADKLVTTQFASSITRGFAAVGEPNVAVCLLPFTFRVRTNCAPRRTTKGRGRHITITFLARRDRCKLSESCQGVP